MKKVTFLFIISQIIFNFCIAQTFRLTDTTFIVGDQLTRAQLYNPNCQIDADNLPFLDSLAKFLIINRQIAIEIDFHSDIRGTAELNQSVTEICGQSRLVSFLKYDYPDINTDRIKFGCFGGSQPIYNQIYIDKIIDKADKEKAYAANRRTVIKITQTNYKN